MDSKTCGQLGNIMEPIYIENYLTHHEELFNYCLSLPWLDKTEARKEFFMAIKPTIYQYGKGNGVREYHSEPISNEVIAILHKLNLDFGTAYEACFYNRYDTERQAIGWHADTFSPNVDDDHPIAVISLGAVREIWWKKQDYKGPIPASNRQKLGLGSLFIMPKGMQQQYFHKIPRNDSPCGIRISLTFRKFLH